MITLWQILSTVANAASLPTSNAYLIPTAVLPYTLISLFVFAVICNWPILQLARANPGKWKDALIPSLSSGFVFLVLSFILLVGGLGLRIFSVPDTPAFTLYLSLPAGSSGPILGVLFFSLSLVQTWITRTMLFQIFHIRLSKPHLGAVWVANLAAIGLSLLIFWKCQSFPWLA